MTNEKSNVPDPSQDNWKRDCYDWLQMLTFVLVAVVMVFTFFGMVNSVVGSSITTVAGFIALCFMSFTLGLDMGVVMAKGVLLGVICCVTVLPSLILVFDKAIWKTAHKTVHLPTDGLSEFVMKHYKLFAVIMVVLWIPALYGNANYNYASDAIGLAFGFCF